MKEQRHKKLIEPRLQLRFSLAFLTTALLLVMVQAIVITFLLQRLASELPNDSLLVQARVPEILVISFLLTFLLLAPLSLAIGIRSTHKVVGPLHRFRVFLGQVAAGERPPPCRIRKGDELQDLCELLNRATAPLREAEADDSSKAA